MIKKDTVVCHQWRRLINGTDSSDSEWLIASVNQAMNHSLFWSKSSEMSLLLLNFFLFFMCYVWQYLPHDAYA